MAASEELARRVVEAGRSCSLTTAVLEEWSRLGTPKQVEYLAGYLEAERSSREASKRATLLRRCALQAPKTFDGYDWSAVSWPEGMGRESLLALDFVERRENLVLMGDVGTGKTHMASALCALACERRLEARFFTASSLVMRLRRARDDGRLDREAALIGKARLLVIDELGFLPLDADGARLLFQVFADAYERQSVVITTNLEFSRWGSVFGDDQMAAAVIGRIVHHGRLVQFRGESYRVRHALMQEGYPLKKRARFRCCDCSISDALFAQILLTKHRIRAGGACSRSHGTGRTRCSSAATPPGAGRPPTGRPSRRRARRAWTSAPSRTCATPPRRSPPRATCPAPWRSPCTRPCAPASSGPCPARAW